MAEIDEFKDRISVLEKALASLKSPPTPTDCGDFRERMAKMELSLRWISWLALILLALGGVAFGATNYWLIPNRVADAIDATVKGRIEEAVNETKQNASKARDLVADMQTLSDRMEGRFTRDKKYNQFCVSFGPDSELCFGQDGSLILRAKDGTPYWTSPATPAQK